MNSNQIQMIEEAQQELKVLENVESEFQTANVVCWDYNFYGDPYVCAEKTVTLPYTLQANESFREG